ncbi:uncharacterized protein BDV14DRAFT_185284 [Aspergillus stella-maris]|uniref:uncharacterized protein n=1 Tax=Aspergillus stella-maris TaxID=1810926 RepID=UPI003CCE464F
MGPASHYKYPRLNPAAAISDLSLFSSPLLFLSSSNHQLRFAIYHQSNKPNQIKKSFLQTTIFKMAHGCSCGDSCQCPAGQCNCPKN